MSSITFNIRLNKPIKQAGVSQTTAATHSHIVIAAKITYLSQQETLINTPIRTITMMTKIFDPNAKFHPIELSLAQAYTPEEMFTRADNFYQTMKTRHTIRDFSDQAVSRDIIEKCVLTAGTAPSGANHQPWHFSIISDAHVKKQIRLAAEEEERQFYEGGASEEWLTALAPLGTDCNKPFLETAPWLIVIFAERFGFDKEYGKYKNYYVTESVGIATGFLIAALHNAGLATLTHTPNPMKFLNTACQRPDNEKAYMILVAGYPAKNVTIPEKSTIKKSLTEIADFI